MYIPRLRRINDVIKEMKTADPNTEVTRTAILFLIKKKKLTPLKYGNAWLINLDELYGYFNGKKKHKPRIDVNPETRLVSSGTIQRLFVHEDEGTIVRRPNLRRFVRDNGITFYITQEVWLIDKESFLAKVNPKNIEEHQPMPRIRCIKTAVLDWNAFHRPRIDKHTVEACIKSRKIFAIKYGNRWLINYDQLEIQIRINIRKKNEKLK